MFGLIVLREKINLFFSPEVLQDDLRVLSLHSLFEKGIRKEEIKVVKAAVVLIKKRSKKERQTAEYLG